MAIVNMKQVSENVGKRVNFQFYGNHKTITGVIVFGEFTDCKGNAAGCKNEYSVRYDYPSEKSRTYCFLDPFQFEDDEILVFELI